MATAAAFQGTLVTLVSWHPKRRPRLVALLTPAYSSLHRGRGGSLGGQGRTPAHPQQRCRASRQLQQVGTGGPGDANLPFPRPAPASCVYLPLGQCCPSKYGPDRLPLVLCLGSWLSAWLTGWTLGCSQVMRPCGAWEACCSHLSPHPSPSPSHTGLPPGLEPADHPPIPPPFPGSPPPCWRPPPRAAFLTAVLLSPQPMSGCIM